MEICEETIICKNMHTSATNSRTYDQYRSDLNADEKPLGVWWKQATPQKKKEMKQKLLPGFVADVLLGNWDVVGLSADNILIDKDGEPWKIDNGGVLGFRAQGARKSKEAWEDGWPDEIWTMRESHNNTPFFGDVSTLDLVQSIADKNWDKALQVIPEKDKAIVAKRLKEIRELAERGTPFQEDGYGTQYVETVLKHSYNLSKEGFRDAVPQKVELDTHGNPKDFGFFRSNIQQQFTSANIPANIPDDSSLWPGIIKKAVITIHHKIAQDLPATSYNWAKVNLAIGLKPKLEILVQSECSGAKHYLKWVEKIEKKSKLKKTKVALPYCDDLVPLIPYVPPINPPTPAPAPATSKYVSLTGWIHQSMRKEEVKVITSWQKGQKINSYKLNACKFKIAHLLSQGITDQKDAEKLGYYIGIENHPDTPGNHYKTIRDAFDFFAKNPMEKEKYLSACAKYQSAIPLIWENSDFPGNDQQSRNVVLMRTENKSIFGRKVLKIGKLSHHTGANESHSIFQTVRVDGSVLTMVRVPYHRITGTYFLEGTPGKHDHCFLGDKENEFNADTHGLDIFAFITKNFPADFRCFDFGQYLTTLKNQRICKGAFFFSIL